MKRKRRLIGIAVAIILPLGVIAIVAVQQIRKPFYVPGHVRSQTNLRSSLEPPPQTDEGFWTVEQEVHLVFEAYGQGPAVLVVHGGPAIPYSEPWSGLASLQKDFRFYYYHQRGCGRSTRPCDRFDGNYYANLQALEQTLGLGAQIADIERIRRILGQEKMTLIGHSFGGFLAALYATEFPERVEKLVLVAPAGLLSTPVGDRDLFTQTRAALAEHRREAFDALLERYLDFGGIFNRSENELADLHYEVGQYILEAMQIENSQVAKEQCGGWAAFACYFSIGLDHDYRAAISEIGTPTLIVYGQDDQLALSGSRSYSLIPNSQFRQIAKSDTFVGHNVYADAPIAFAEALKEFLFSAEQAHP